MQRAIRVLLADDHQMIRQGLASLLRSEPEIDVVGEAADGGDAVRLAGELAPDVVLMDVWMPGGVDGVEATRQIRAAAGDVRVVALGAHIDERVAAELLRAGASGLLLKANAFEEVVTAVRTVAAGKAYLSPSVTRAVAGNLTGRGPVVANLSPRERETLQLLAQGLATKQIARQLHVSVKTIETHRRNLMEKLDMHSVAELTKCAIREGLTSVQASETNA